VQGCDEVSCCRAASVVFLLFTVFSWSAPAPGGAMTAQDVAVRFNGAMNRCFATKCSNVDDLLALFSDDAVYFDGGLLSPRARSPFEPSWCTPRSRAQLTE
jgi:hypothetical protein